MKENWIKNIIILSGGFDPVHKGHIRMFREAANLGAQVIVGLNSDDWLIRKKVKLKIGNEKIIGILALASKEREKFTAQQGVELLEFMGSVFERRISHWLN